MNKKVATTILSVALVSSMISAAAVAQPFSGQSGSNDMMPVTLVNRQGDGIGQGGLSDRSVLDAIDASIEQEGSLKITDPGTYVLTGNLQGTVVVDPGAGDVTLVMDGAAIDGAGGPGIVAKSGDRLTIQLPEGSVNTITNGMDAPGACPAIASIPELRFEGEGILCAPDDVRQGCLVEQAGMHGQFGPLPGMEQPGQLGLMPGMEQGQFGQQSGDLGQSGQVPGGQNGMMPSQPPTDQGQEGQPAMPGQQTIASTTDSATEVATGTMTNSAADLEADYENAISIVMTDENGQVKITSSGTYIITGSSSDGNITVKKGTEGVVMILENLDLTSTTGATVSVNKEAEVKIIISGEVVLTDAEDPDDEYSTDADVAAAYDGAALKAKANSQVYVTGDGTLVINGNAKNGIKAGDDSSLIFDGVTVNIEAENDGINANYDLTLLSGSFTIAAGDDAIHAEHILTVGSEDGTGPVINVTSCTEGLEGTVVNIYGGDISIVSKDDAVNAANGDGLYEGELEYSFNMMGGKLAISSSGDGIDSNGNVNLIGGTASIRSAAGGGEAGIDYDGELYVSDEFNLVNNSGIAGPDNMGGPMMDGFMNGAFAGMDFGPMQFGQEPGNMSGDHGPQAGQFGNRR